MTCNRAPSGAVTHTRGVVPASVARRHTEQPARQSEERRGRKDRRPPRPPPPPHRRHRADARHRQKLCQRYGRAEEERRQAQRLLRYRQRRTVDPSERPPRAGAPEEPPPHCVDVVDGRAPEQVALERVGDAQSESGEKGRADHRRSHGYMYWPPLMLSCAPVIQSPSVQRNRTRRATSSASPKREAAVRLRPVPPALSERTKKGASPVWKLSTSPARSRTLVSPCRTRPGAPKTCPRNAASGSVSSRNCVKTSTFS